MYLFIYLFIKTTYQKNAFIKTNNKSLSCSENRELFSMYSVMPIDINKFSHKKKTNKSFSM